MSSPFLIDDNDQPLMDNLPSTTYQSFEQDPVKYAQYEEVRLFAVSANRGANGSAGYVSRILGSPASRTNVRI